ncbi:MAG: SDR family oxidoreductase [Deltaproteobacteria bacterium]|nr:SDR family oxidoreductase [Deltaproteobacteria bacterium]
MELGLKGKVALVTGASRGIGAAIAKSLGSAGAHVVVNYFKSEGKAEDVLKEIKRLGGDGITFKADVREKGDVEAMVAGALKKFGRIDILVNNANIAFPVKPFMDYGWDEAEAKITGEMKALFLCSQAAVKDMLKRRSGKIIHISSGLSRYPSEGFFAHAAAKAAMDSSARIMAKELGPQGITVNVVGPGLIPTDATAPMGEEMFKAVANFTPLKRVGTTDEIAGVVTFLSSSLSDFVNGQYIHVNGGAFMP